METTRDGNAQQPLIEYARAALAAGFAVFPCHPRSKKPATQHGFENASKDPAQVEAWWRKNADCNPAIACGASGLVVIDADHGFTSLEQAEAWRANQGLPRTYAVRTGRRPEYGIQFYYRGARSDSTWEKDGAQGQVKSLGGYVMGEGSIHPDSGERYEVAINAPIATLPPGLFERQRKATPPPQSGETIPRGNRDNWLTSQAGRLVNAGLSGNTLLASLRALNSEHCDPPLDNADVERIAASADRNFKPRDELQELAELVADFNSRFFVVANFGNKCRVCWLEPERHPDLKGRLRLGVQTFDDFKKRFMHQVLKVGQYKNGSPILRDKGSAWLEHPNRRQFQEVVFAPGSEIGPDVLNLWKGFAVEPREGDCHLFLKHLEEVICAGHDLTYAYLINWLARGVQSPGERAHTAVVVRGEKGVGKNFFADTYGELFGSHCITVANAEHIVGRFNDHLRTCVVLIGNEAFFAGNKQHEAVLKTLVTDTVLTIERKYVDLISSPNLLHVILLSNSDWVVPASADERRFLMVDASNVHKGDMTYFRALAQELDNGGREALLDYLLKLDISRFEPRYVPKTAALWQQMSESLTGVEAAWFECLHSGEIPAEVEKDGTAKLRSASFIEWAGERNPRWRGITHEQLGHLLGNNPHRGDRCMGFPRAEVSIAGGRRKVRLIPTLAECRNLWNVKRFGVTWDGVREHWTSCTGCGVL